MNAIDNLVFNTLTQQGAIYLPAIGCLHTVCKSCQVEGAATKSPKIMVVFSKKTTSNSISVIDLIAKQDQIDVQGAQTLYNEWLSGVCRAEGEIVIEGVGTLNKGSFTTDAELMTALNGEATPAVTSGCCKCKKCRWVWWVVAVVVLVAAVVAFIFCCPCCQEENCEEEVVVEIVEPAPVEEVVEPVATIAPVGKARYNISVGVFEFPQNADKCAASDPVGIGKENYLIDNFPQGWKVVIAYSTDDWNEAVEAWRKFKTQVSDVWIYRKY